MTEKIMEYFETTVYPMVLLLLIFFLLANMKSAKSRYVFSFIIILIASLPILYYVCVMIGQKEETYRFMWLLPLSLIWALEAVWLWKKSQYHKIAFLALFFCSFMILGTSIQKPDGMSHISNEYSLDREMMQVFDQVKDHCCDTKVRIIGEPELMIQARQYSSNLCWAYTGRGQMIMAQEEVVDAAFREDIQYRLAMAIEQGKYLDEEKLADDLQALSVEYIVIPNDNTFVEHLPGEIYNKVGGTKQYSIFNMNYKVGD